VETSSAPLPVLSKLPNGLTVLRFLLIPAFIVVYANADNGHSWAAGIIFGLAGFTDQIDGWLARRWHVESEFGKYADPLADRLMIDTAVVMLVVYDRLPWPALAVIVARDAFLIVGTRIAVTRGYDFSVSALGKAATWFLYGGVAFLLVTVPGTRWPLVLFWTGLGMAVVAAVLYSSAAWATIRKRRSA